MYAHVSVIEVFFIVNNEWGCLSVRFFIFEKQLDINGVSISTIHYNFSDKCAKIVIYLHAHFGIINVFIYAAAGDLSSVIERKYGNVSS